LQGVEKALAAYLDAVEGTPAKGAASHASIAALPAEFTEKLARFIESALAYLGDGKQLAAETAEMLIQALRNSPGDFRLIQDLLVRLSHQTEVAGGEQTHIRNALLNLLRLIIENIGELALDESWLKGQIDGLLAVIEPPVTRQQLDEMERRLRQVIAKQGEIMRQSVEAQKELRAMLAAFVVSLATMNKSSSVFQSTIEESARKIEEVKRIEDLAPLLKEVIDATHAMAEETSHTRDQLKGMQEKVDSTEATLVRLYEELDNASAQARHDPLTDALNRKGLDDALAREIASVRRRNVQLSICLLDIDNFKKLNDRLGHEAGDQALIHLAKVARQCVRPNDTLARYGGEEFIILMPETRLEDGIEAMVRLQRELTKKFFMSDTEKILITFSAGVAQLGTDEPGIDAIKRADQAMYRAKRAGKNRVEAG
jgi:diguanylate cyclase